MSITPTILTMIAAFYRKLIKPIGILPQRFFFRASSCIKDVK
jgi:hypothetical protein